MNLLLIHMWQTTPTLSYRKVATLAGEERRLLAQALERYVWQSIEGCEISGNNSRHDEI